MADTAANLTPTVHASAVLVGPHAVLIRGASGAGKSSLALDLLQAAATGALRFARLVADDRCHLEARAGRLLVRPAPQLAGLIEVRGLGIRQLPYEPVAVVGLVIDLGAASERMPAKADEPTKMLGIAVRRLAVAGGSEALRAILAVFRIPAAGI